MIKTNNQSMLMPDIIIMGMFGSGKTTIARELSKRMKRSLYDVDELLERASGRTVGQLLELHGDNDFLQAEAKLIMQTFRQYIDGILSLSGSVPLKETTMEHLGKLGTLIYLDTPIGDIQGRSRRLQFDRVVGRYDESGRERTLQEIFDMRRASYERWAQGAIRICTHGKDTNMIVKEIISKIS